MNANPLSKLTDAEATLIASLDAATVRLEQVGTSSLDAALERLRVAAHAATGRLAEAGAIVASLAGDVLACVLDVAMGIEEAMGREDASIGIPTDAAQVQPALGYTYTEPSDMVNPASLSQPSPEVEPEPSTRRTGFPIADAFLDIAREAESETVTPQPVEPQTPRERYPVEPPASSPDGPTLFDADGNEADPTDVLTKPYAVPYVASAPTPRPGTNGDGGATHAVASPQRRRKGR